MEVESKEGLDVLVYMYTLTTEVKLKMYIIYIV